MLYDRILRIIKNFDATFNELLGFDVLFEGWKVETSVDLVWTCLGWFSSNDLAGRVGPLWSLIRIFCPELGRILADRAGR